jgi:hypothetical protein
MHGGRVNGGLFGDPNFLNFQTGRNTRKGSDKQIPLSNAIVACINLTDWKGMIPGPAPRVV